MNLEIGPWATLFLLFLATTLSSVVFFYLLTPVTFEALIADIPILKDDPFVHIVFGVFSNGNHYSYWQYLLTVAVMAPGGYVAVCFVISVISGEWSQRRSAAMAQMKEAALHLFLSAPFMSYMFKNFIEGKWGFLFYNQPIIKSRG